MYKTPSVYFLGFRTVQLTCFPVVLYCTVILLGFHVCFLCLFGTYLTANIADTAEWQYVAHSTKNVHNTTINNHNTTTINNPTQALAKEKEKERKDSNDSKYRRKEGADTVVCCEYTGMPRLVASLAANSALSMYRDVTITRLQASPVTHLVPPPAPPSVLKLKGNPVSLNINPTALAAFLSRDLLAMGSSFTLPPVASSHLQHLQPQWTAAHCDLIAQLSIPVLFQVLITPFHIAGIYLTATSRSIVSPSTTCATSTENRDRDKGSAGMWRAIRRGYVSSTLLRMLRVFPSFGLGGCANIYFRKLHSTAVN